MIRLVLKEENNLKRKQSANVISIVLMVLFVKVKISTILKQN
jgi:putative ribosome biogenesis GTPase RsgA